MIPLDAFEGVLRRILKVRAAVEDLS